MRGRLRLLSTCERRCRVLRYKWKQREAARTRGQMPAVLRGGGSTHARPPWAFCPPHRPPTPVRGDASGRHLSELKAFHCLQLLVFHVPFVT